MYFHFFKPEYPTLGPRAPSVGQNDVILSHPETSQCSYRRVMKLQLTFYCISPKATYLHGRIQAA